MKPNYKVVSASLAMATLLGLGTQALADNYTRYPDRPGRRVAESSGIPEVSKLPPRDVSAKPVFSDEEVAPASTFSRKIRKAVDPNNDFLGNIFGVCNRFPNMTNESDYAKSFWGKIDFSNYTVSPLYSGIDFVNTGDQEHQTGAVRDGILYIPEGVRSSVRDFEVIWKRFDINSGKWLPSIACGDNLNLWVANMCYDPRTDAFYGMSALEESGTTRYGRLVRIDLDPESEMPVATVLRDIPANYPLAGGFFYNPSTKDIMVVCDDFMLYSMNRENGNFIKVAELYCDDNDVAQEVFVKFEDRGTQNIVYSPRDELALWCIPGSYGGANDVLLFSLDTDDGEVSFLGYLEEGTVLTSLYTPDTFARPEAADVMEINSFNLAGNSLSGSVDMTVPTTLYNGLELKSNVTVVSMIDNAEISRINATPGQKVNVPFTVAEGIHTFTVRADISNSLQGPLATKKFFAGNDTPVSPTGLKMTDSTLTWTAPGAEGANFGYVDTSALTYDVYFDNVKQNATPITTNSYTFTAPSEMSRVDVTVTASYAGKTSRPSEALSTVIGSSLSLPYTATPEAKQASLFTIIDSNHDGATFEYVANEKKFEHSYENYEGSNDWLILPALDLTDASKMYEFSFDYQSYTPYYGSENISICIGDKPEVSAMTELNSYKEVTVADGKKLPVTTRFSVKKAGKYYLAIHVRQGGAGSGSKIYNFSVSQLSSSTAVPGKASNLTVRAAEKGELKAFIDLTLPTVDASGKALNASSTLTANVRNFDQEESHIGSATGTPGSRITVECPGVNGFNSFLVSVSNNEGEGAEVSARGYIGIDTPVKVSNLKSETTADNLSMLLTWDPVTEGVNGGFIDPENLEYQMWYNTQGVTWNKVGNPVKQTSVIFDPQSEVLHRWKVSVFAQNSAGFEKAISNDRIVNDILGKPAVLPVIEPFGLSGNAYTWNFETDTDATVDSYIRQILSDEVPYLGIGNALMDDGSGRLVTSYYPGNGQEAEFLVPKFTTKDVKNPTFEMKIWNYSLAPRFKIYARTFENQTPVEIADVDIDRGNFNSWRDYLLALPEQLQNQEWVQLRIHFYVPKGNNAYGLIDEINIFSDVDLDAKVVDIADVTETHVGDNMPMSVTVVNAGRENLSSYVRVDVVGDGKVLDSQTYNVARIRPLRSNVKRLSLEAKAEYLNYKKIEVRATTLLEGDQNPSNDTKSVVWDVVAPIAPVVSDLSGWISGNDTKLGWTAPEHAYGSFDEFENLTPFDYSETLGQWKNFNGDNYETFAIAGLMDIWPSAEVPRAWQVVNDARLGVHGDSRLGAHSGNQYLMAFAGYDPNDPSDVQVAKWLISPEVKGGTEVKFWVNTPDPTYRETIHVMYSTTDDKPESFVKLCNRSKEGSEGWEQTSFTLPPNAKYFAFKYVGWNTLGILVDDLQFVPLNPDVWSIEQYNIYRKLKDEKDFRLIGSSEINGFTDNTRGDAEAQYYITVSGISPNGVHADGPKSNIITIGISGIEVLEALNGVAGGKAEMIFDGHAGAIAEIYSTDGKRVATPQVKSDHFTLPIEKGIYMVILSGKTCKVVVK